MSARRFLSRMFLGLWLFVAHGPANAGCVLDKLAELPVTMAGLRPMVAAKINGADALFIADSGAFFSVISPGSAAEFGLQLEPLRRDMIGIGGTAELSLATVKDFTLAGLPMHGIPFLVGGSETGHAGLLGQNVFSIADVEYDLGGGVIRLIRPRSCGGADLAYWAEARPVSELDINLSSPANPHTIGTVTLDGVRIHAAFDTGAERTLVSLAAAARAGVRPGTPGVILADDESGIGRNVGRSWIAPFAELDIGGEKIRGITLHVADIGLPDIDMLIGADFFISHRVYVANGQHRLYFTYEGGPVFAHPAREAAATQPPSPDPGAIEPADADAFSRRGAALAAKQDYDRAIADFTRASAMAPGNPDYLVERAEVRIAQEQPLSARADLDAAIKLAPADPRALIARADLLLDASDAAAAIVDLDAAAAAVAKPSDLRLAIGGLYGRAEAFDRAIGQDDLWIANHPVDSRQPRALNARCWERALLGTALDKALADCNRALRLRPGAPEFLDSRGMAELRAGLLDKAIADYDAALGARPGIAWSLYGRGLARLSKGLAPAGKADIAAAVAIEPDLPAKAARYGIVARDAKTP